MLRTFTASVNYVMAKTSDRQSHMVLFTGGASNRFTRAYVKHRLWLIQRRLR